MSRKPRLDAANRTRASVICSKQQKLILEEAAAARGTDLSTMLLAFALNGLGAFGTADKKTIGALAGEIPVIINGEVGATLRARAAKHGVPPERMLELLLGAGG